MTTETLCTKYRPEDFRDVIGQEFVVRSLRGLVEKGTSRTVLLAGPSGTGKTTLARICAKVLGCEPADVQEIDAATFTGIDDMRAIIKPLQYRPLGNSKAKVLIVDECHRLSKQAWDSMLKSLEEPPPWVWWFLCTTNPAAVPATIQTRCAKYELKAVEPLLLEELLMEVSEAEKHPDGADWEAIVRLCAKHAQGSPRAALANLGACWEARTKTEALALLKSAEGSAEAVELAKALVAGKPWHVLVEIIQALKEQNPESVRHVVRAYVTAVIVNSKGKGQEANFAVLEAFSQPFPSGDGISPLVLAVGKLLFLEGGS